VSIFGRSGRILCGLLFLCLAGSVPAWPGNADSRDLRSLSSPFLTGWALADFNGDRTIDVARSRAVGRDGGGYTQQILIQSGSSQQSFAFRSRAAKVQLGARDIDGDEDRDIVVLEPWSMVPIGVWLNDGAGNFSEGNLADFRSLVDTRGSRTMEAPAGPQQTRFDISEQRSEPVSPRTWLVRPDRSVEAFFIRKESARTSNPSEGVRSRAPPASPVSV
jgi:hypothetical protein